MKSKVFEKEIMFQIYYLDFIKYINSAGYFVQK
nr:MAG TPA: hypothetical protein [Bacteriophage sp.]